MGIFIEEILRVLYVPDPPAPEHNIRIRFISEPNSKEVNVYVDVRRASDIIAEMQVGKRYLIDPRTRYVYNLTPQQAQQVLAHLQEVLRELNEGGTRPD
jgi:hypothetical protein